MAPALWRCFSSPPCPANNFSLFARFGFIPPVRSTRGIHPCDGVPRVLILHGNGARASAALVHPHQEVSPPGPHPADGGNRKKVTCVPLKLGNRKAPKLATLWLLARRPVDASPSIPFSALILFPDLQRTPYQRLSFMCIEHLFLYSPPALCHFFVFFVVFNDEPCRAASEHVNNNSFGYLLIEYSILFVIIGLYPSSGDADLGESGTCAIRIATQVSTERSRNTYEQHSGFDRG